MPSPGGSRPTALVYRSPKLSDGCPESLANLLASSPSKFLVTYVGPKEAVKLSRAALEGADLFAVGGGPDVESLYKELDKSGNVHAIQRFVAEGGTYIGICLGAYLAGTLPGLDLLPAGCQTDEETEQQGAAVTDSRDTVVQIDWKHPCGTQQGKEKKGVWAYFQDGTVVQIPKKIENVQVIARYSSNQDVATCINPYGKGWVGLSGVHLEADQSWYDEEDFTNPDGIYLSYGHELIEATFHASRT